METHYLKIFTFVLIIIGISSGGTAPGKSRHRRQAANSVDVLKLAMAEGKGFKWSPKRLPMLAHVSGIV